MAPSVEHHERIKDCLAVQRCLWSTALTLLNGTLSWAPGERLFRPSNRHIYVNPLVIAIISPLFVSSSLPVCAYQ
jgi:hypothetical protein